MPGRRYIWYARLESPPRSAAVENRASPSGLHESLRDFCSVGQRSRARCSMALRVVRTCAEPAPDSTQHAARTSGRHRPNRTSRERKLGARGGMRVFAPGYDHCVICTCVVRVVVENFCNETDAYEKFCELCGYSSCSNGFSKSKNALHQCNVQKYLIVF